MSIHDPVSGEVAVAEEGEAIYWRGQKWHFGYNFGRQETLILDWAAPAERAADVPEVKYPERSLTCKRSAGGRYELLGRWPAERPAVRETAWRDGGMITVGRQDCLHLIHGDDQPSLVSLFVSTPVITCGVIDLLPGHMAESKRAIRATKSSLPPGPARRVLAGHLRLVRASA